MAAKDLGGGGWMSVHRSPAPQVLRRHAFAFVGDSCGLRMTGRVYVLNRALAEPTQYTPSNTPTPPIVHATS